MSDFDITTIVQQTALNVNTIGKSLGVLTASIGEIKNEINDIKAQIGDNRAEIETMKRKERIDRTEARRLRAAIHARVDLLLNITREGGVVTKGSLLNDKKYRGGFIGRCYHDARHYSRLGTPYYDTTKQDYKETIAYIANWEPEVQYAGLTGTDAYKKYLDDRASA